MSFPCRSLTILGSAVPTIVWSREARNRASRTAPTIAAFARPSRTGAAPAASGDALKTGPLSRRPNERVPGPAGEVGPRSRGRNCQGSYPPEPGTKGRQSRGPRGEAHPMTGRLLPPSLDPLGGCPASPHRCPVAERNARFREAQDGAGTGPAGVTGGRSREATVGAGTAPGPPAR